MNIQQSIKIILLAFLSLLILACLPQDKKNKNQVKNDAGQTVSATELKLNGFWTGQFNQAGSIRALIYNGNIYAIDEDKTFAGTINNPQDDDLDFDFKTYSFTDQDTSNLEFTSDGTGTGYKVEGLLATADTIVGTYQTDGGDFGNLALENTKLWENNSSLTGLTGKWTTPDHELSITSKGQFLGFSKATANNCSYSGKIELIDAGKVLMKLAIERKNCSSANGEFTGFAAVNAEKALELYAVNTAGHLLFMTFTAPAAATDSSSGGTSSGATSSASSSTGGATSSGSTSSGAV